MIKINKKGEGGPNMTVLAKPNNKAFIIKSSKKEEFILSSNSLTEKKVIHDMINDLKKNNLKQK